MTDTFRRLGRLVPGTTTGGVYTVPSNTQAIVREIRCVNTDRNAPHDLSLYEGGATNADLIEAVMTLAPGETRVVRCFITLAAGGNIQAKAGDATGAINVTAYGLEIS